jgi:sec-independent protein translocase protein TatC
MKDPTEKIPVLAHVQELKNRLMKVCLMVVVFTIAAYSVRDKMLEVIQRPLNQTLYFTSPAGGFSFVFKMSAWAGIVVATPYIMYQTISFLRPLLSHIQRWTIVLYVVWSLNLALAGVLFAYFFSLPAALHFLARFSNEHIKSLITADAYFNFALAYLAGFAVLFQLPLVIMIINKMRPLTARRMLRAQRYIILISFIVAAILTPTPDPINQTIMALPVVLLYQISIVLIVVSNSKAKRQSVRAVAQSR